MGGVDRQVAKLLGMGSTQRAGSSTQAPVDLRDGVVTRVDPDGSVWVTPLDGDARSPLGPVLGATRPVLVTLPGGAYELRALPLPLRVRVLFAVTGAAVWIVRTDTRGV